jgi:hypothetical protein
LSSTEQLGKRSVPIQHKKAHAEGVTANPLAVANAKSSPAFPGDHPLHSGKAAVDPAHLGENIMLLKALKA